MKKFIYIVSILFCLSGCLTNDIEYQQRKPSGKSYLKIVPGTSIIEIDGGNDGSLPWRGTDTRGRKELVIKVIPPGPHSLKAEAEFDSPIYNHTNKPRLFIIDQDAKLTPRQRKREKKGRIIINRGNLIIQNFNFKEEHEYCAQVVLDTENKPFLFIWDTADYPLTK